MTLDELREWRELAVKMDEMTDHEYLRKHILECSGVVDKVHRVDYDQAVQAIGTQMQPFFDLQRNRILMGRFRYGEWGDRYVDYQDDMERCLELYLETRNTEYLVDLANYAWIEFRYGSNPEKHFTTIDDGEHSRQ